MITLPTDQRLSNWPSKYHSSVLYTWVPTCNWIISSLFQSYGVPRTPSKKFLDKRERHFKAWPKRPKYCSDENDNYLSSNQIGPSIYQLRHYNHDSSQSMKKKTQSVMVQVGIHWFLSRFLVNFKLSFSRNLVKCLKSVTRCTHDIRSSHFVVRVSLTRDRRSGQSWLSSSPAPRIHWVLGQEFRQTVHGSGCDIVITRSTTHVSHLYNQGNQSVVL